jgi:hypothetical protein
MKRGRGQQHTEGKIDCGAKFTTHEVFAQKPGPVEYFTHPENNIRNLERLSRLSG